MNVLITGIEGFVGSHLAEFLLKKTDAKIFGTVQFLNRTQNIEHIRSSLQLFEANILEREKLSSLLQQISPDIIFHLAAQAFVPTAIDKPYDTFQTNINGALHLLETIRSKKIPSKIIIVSTGEVYGNVMENELPITELSPLKPNNPYATSKACIDLLAQTYKQSFGVNVIVGRPFNHAGPRQNPVFVCSDFAKQLIEIKKGIRPPTMTVGNLLPIRDFVDVRDVVRAYWLLATKDVRFPVYNVCAQNPRSIDSVLQELISISNVNVTIQQDASRLRSYDISKIYGSAQRLNDECGWKAEIPFSQTLNDTLNYWEKELA